MWSRSELKERAKNVLRYNYWKAFVISLVVFVASSSAGGSSGRGGSGNRGGTLYNSSFPFFRPEVLITIGIAAILTILFFIAIRILIGYPLEVGGRRYFIKSALFQDNSGCFSFAFNGENYRGILPAMFLRSLYVFLWSLLLIIPGIIKSYAYSMVPYILAEDPNVGAVRALEISNDMTRGHKFDMFVLDLSFLGWYLLGALALGIGTFFVLPYDYSTKAELYLVLKGYYFGNNAYQA